MPHINRIRVNNVKYNFGTQYYDDFVMRFSGKNTIYDLANGGEFHGEPETSFGSGRTLLSNRTIPCTD